MIEFVRDLLPEVLAGTPGCPDMIAERALRQAARHLCQQTHCWRYTTEVLPVIKGLREVELDLPRDAGIARVWWAKLGDERLTGVSASRIEVREGRPTGYALSPAGAVMLDCLPLNSYVTDGLTLHASLMPTRASEVLPEFLDPFLEGITAKATADLLLTPNVDWHNRQAAADQLAVYRDYARDAAAFGKQFDQPIHRTVKYGGI